MVHDTTTEASPRAGVAWGGPGYRAITTSGGRVAWACAHVHFTDPSARACAERHVMRGRKLYGSGSEGGRGNG